MRLLKPLVTCIVTACILSSLLIYPSSSDTLISNWTITDTQVVKDTTITLNGNLTVKTGGNLTLNNVTLKIASDSINHYEILAEPNSALIVSNCSILPVDGNFSPVISINAAAFSMKNTFVQLGQGENVIITNTDDCKFENNTINVTGRGGCSFNFRFCRSLQINNNVLTSSGQTNTYLSVQNSNNTSILNNTMTAGGISFIYSWNNTVKGNLFYVKAINNDAGGVCVMPGSGNTIIDNNTFVASAQYSSVCTAFRLMGVHFPTSFTNNVIIGNRFIGNMTPFNDYIGFRTSVYIAESSNAIIANNTFSNLLKSVKGASQGDVETPNQVIQVYRSSNNFILNNNIESTNSGIELFASSDNTLKGNVVLNCGTGLGLYYNSDNNLIEGNTLENNSISFVTESSLNNTLHYNILTSRERPAYNINSSNTWNQNYWNNYGANNTLTYYPIPYGGVDNQPLVSRPLLSQVGIPSPKWASYQNYFLIDSTGPYGISPQINENLVIANQTINLNTDVQILGNVSLTLQNVSIIVTPSREKYMYGLWVRSGGTLNIDNCSVICAADGTSLGLNFDYNTNCFIKNSSFYNCGGTGTQVGPVFFFNEGTTSNNVTIVNNTLVGCKGVIGVANIPNLLFINNTAINCYFGVSIAGCANAQIIGNTIINCIHDSLITGTGPKGVVIESNIIADTFGYLDLVTMSKNTTSVNNQVTNYYGGYPVAPYIGSNAFTKALTSNFTYPVDQTFANQPLTFNASVATPGSGVISNYNWNFGDGITATGKTVQHTYLSQGAYVVTLNITNTAGLWDIKSQSVTIQPQTAQHTPTPSPSPSPSSPSTPATTQPTPQPTIAQPTTNPTTTPTQTPTNTPSSSPTIPELSALTILMLFMVVPLSLAIVVLVKRRNPQFLSFSK